MKTEHTPGPWKQVPQSTGGPIIAHEFETGNEMNPRGLRLICQVLQRGKSLETDQANARLIASAPALLAALQKCGEMVQRLANYGKFRGLLQIGSVMKSVPAWAQECVDEAMKVISEATKS